MSLILKQEPANTIATPPAGKSTLFVNDNSVMSVKSPDGNVTQFPTVAGANTQVQFNNSGAFGASANLTFTDTSQLNIGGNVNLTAGLQLAHVSAPGAVGSTTILHGGGMGSGGTGLFFVDGSDADELVSKSKAIVFGIIF